MANEVREFQDACGAPARLRLAIEFDGSKGAVEREVEAAHFLIGKDPGCTLCLDHKAVEERHAYLQVVNGQVFCMDLASRCGTHWENGSEGSGWLRPGQRIRIGPFRIRLLEQGMNGNEGHAFVPLPSPLQRLSSEEDPFPAVTLTFVEGANEQLHWRMRQTLVLLGKSSRCKVQLGGPDVLRFHGSLVRTPHGVWFVDFGGLSHINGASACLARLAHGDRLKIGQFCMRAELKPANHPSLSTSRALVKQMSAPARLPAPTSSREMTNSVPAHLQETQLLASRAQFAVPTVADLHALSAAWLQSFPSLPTSGAKQDYHVAALSGSNLEHLVGHVNLMQQQMAVQHMQLMTSLCQVLGTLLKDQRSEILEELGKFQEATRELQSLQAQLVFRSPDLPEEQIPAPGSPELETALCPAPTEGGAPAQAEPTAAGHEVNAEHRAVKPHSPHVHSVLIERMAALQNEQQTRWQKILGAVRNCLPGAGV